MKNSYFSFNRLIITFPVVFLLACAFQANAEKISYSDSWGQQGVTLNTQSTNGVSLNFSISEFSLDSRVINGENMQEISLDGIFLPNNEGAPNLPTLSRYVAIPQGSVASLEIINMRKESFQNVEMAPAPRIPLETERGPLQYNRDMSIYAKNAFYPAQPAIISQTSIMRGLDVVMLSVTPYQYNPVTKELVVYRDLEVKVNFTGGNGHFGDDRLRSRFWDPILMDNTINSASLPAIDYSARTVQQSPSRAPSTTGCEYLIIVPTDAVFSQWADTIKAFRTEQGISTNIVTLQQIGGNNSTLIENYINDAYNNWDIPPSAILIMADFGNGTSTSNAITAPIWDNYCASDNIYGDVDNDDLPDIAMARMTANNATQLETYVRKFKDFEMAPPTDPNFYLHPITALGWQTERWFQICSEVVGGFLKDGLGKEPVRINAVYQGNPNVDPWSTATNTSTVLSYFGPAGLGYIPATPQELGGFAGGTPADVNTALNAGSFMLQHRDHGMETGWGEPGYTNSNIDGLTNVGKLSYIFSVNCLTGKYNWNNECFAEKFHRYKYQGQNAGCVGILAASEVSYSFVNDTYVWGLYDNMWPQFMPGYGAMFQERGLMPCFGNAAGKYFLHQSSWPYNTGDKDVTYHLFHHHGDAFLTLYSEVPQTLTVMHSEVMISAATTFNVTANEGSFIALTANGQIIGTGTGNGSSVAIPVVAPAIGTIVKVVVTKQNYYRHYSYVTVISPENPYVITDNFTVNDPAGNNNLQLDFNEDAFLSLSEKNLGNNPAENVVVTLILTDPYITLLDNTETYPTIPSQQIVTVENGFKVHISGNVPNGYQKMVTVMATDGTDTWLSYITLNCQAPALSAGNIIIDDSQGGNGNNRLDPGETAVIKIPTTNSGLSGAPDVISSINVNSGLLTLLNNTAALGTINPMETAYALFNVEVSLQAPMGVSIGLDYTATSGLYVTTRSYNIQAGLVVEDWETGDFTKFPWVAGGNLPWTITNLGTFEGQYSAKSGAVANSQSSQLILTYDVPANDSIKFHYKVSSEPTNDGLKFYVDNTIKGSYSGNVPWTQVSVPITAGTHLFKWIYTKNGSGSTGSDCAWIDFIILPVPVSTTAYAGMDGFVCHTDNYHCYGNASNYSTVAWTTSGTGTFSNPTILNPIYTPSAADITAGSVVLTITVNGVSGTIVDDMLLSIQQPATAYSGANADLCSGATHNILDATATNNTSVFWTTSGTGTFTNPSMLFCEYIPSADDITAGLVTLTLTASNQSCGAVTSSKTLSIHATPATQVTGEGTVCAQTAGSVYSTPSGTGNTYQWTVTGGTIASGAGTNQISVNWGADITGNVSVTENTVHNCQATSAVPVTINPVPATVISGNNTGCEGDNTAYSTPAGTGNSYNWTITGGTITSGQGTNQVQVTWNTVGANNISVTETIDATLCATTKNTGVTINGLAGIPAKPTGPVSVDLYSVGSSDYSVTPATNAESYVWQLLPAEAGIVSGNTVQANVVWNSTFRGNATLNAKSVNNCGESVWSELITVSVFSSLGLDDNTGTIGINVTPNPNDGNFTLKVNTPTKCQLNIRITAGNGAVVYEKTGIESDGKFIEPMQLNLAQGTYSITISNTEGFTVKKIVVTK